MTIGIVDLGISNVKSVQNMVKKIGADALISSNPNELAKCKKIILPGVGSFDAGVNKIREKDLLHFFADYVSDDENQLLGICLGMQLLTCQSEEGILPGLGLVEAETIKFQKTEKNLDLKVPNMGWREVTPQKQHFLLDNFNNWRFYFVHSYYVQCANSDDVLLSSNHGIQFTAGFVNKNIFGLQFHPEKSHRFGMMIFKNFCLTMTGGG